MATKLYPFSKKYEHDIQYVRNIIVNMILDYEHKGLGRVSDTNIETKEVCERILMGKQDSKVFWLDGKTYGKAIEISIMAQNIRGEKNYG